MKSGNVSVTYDVTKLVMQANAYMDFEVEHGEEISTPPHQQRIEAARWLLCNLMLKNEVEAFDDGTCLVLTFEYETWDEAEAFRDRMTDVDDIMNFLAAILPEIGAHWMHCRLHDGPSLQVATNMLDEIRESMARRGLKFSYKLAGNDDDHYVNYSVLVEVM